MKIYLGAALLGLASLAISDPVLAVTHTIGLAASVSPNCTVSTPPTASGNGFSSISAIASTFTATISSGAAVASNGTLTFSAVSCNGGPIKVTLNPMGTALVTSGSAGANQTNRIDYTAEAKLNGLQQVALLNTTSNPLIAVSGNSGATSGSIDLKLSILPTPSGTTLVVGNYAGTLKVDFDPN